MKALFGKLRVNLFLGLPRENLIIFNDNYFYFSFFDEYFSLCFQSAWVLATDKNIEKNKIAREMNKYLKADDICLERRREK